MEDPRVGLIVCLVIQLVCDLEDMGSTMVGRFCATCRIFVEVRRAGKNDPFSAVIVVCLYLEYS